MLAAVILFVITVYLLFILLKPRYLENFPPGPTSYPIIGSTLFIAKLGKTANEAFSKLGEIYGPITGLIFQSSSQGIIINGYEASKEFYTRDEFAHRPDLFQFSYRWGGRMLGVFFSNGRLWQENRRFALRHLRDFGFGKTSMEGMIHEEAEECINSIIKATKEVGPNSVIPVHDKFGISVINILWAIMGGTRYKHDDESFKKMLKVIQESFRTGSPRGNLVNMYPRLRHLPYFKQKFKTLTAGVDAVCGILEVAIEEHKTTRDPSSPRDLIDVYLQAMEETKNDPDTIFFKEQLVQMCSDLFTAGSESTSNSIAFAVLHMIRNPEIQEKVHKELDTVIGRDRLPSFDDKQKLPYTFAVISESFRMTPIAPISVPHFNVEEVELLGYKIPKGTWAMVNYPSINMDKKYWHDPENFRPERFLDKNGEFIKAKLDHVFGFGLGKRQCLGEPLARMSNYLLFTVVMQRLKFEAVSGQPKPTLEPVDGFTIAPQPFSAKVTVRY